MPPSDSAPSASPRVVAVLVVHDGAGWLPSVLATMRAQRYPALDLVVVDNASSDGSADLLARRIPPDRLLRLPRNVGFGRAVVTALQHEAVSAADMLLLLHDDLALAPDAIAALVRALQDDPSLAIVGPKLREWSADYVLQQVGMTIDRFGRAETQLDVGELDQGQHDRAREVLYVSTAGMLLRRDVLRGLGGFDARFPLFRDDLDLCWRAWLAGHRVGVEPAAVGYHIAAGSRRARKLTRGGGAEARYLAERHAVAALLKNYGRARLAWVLPLMLALALGKTVAFLATRRVGAAAAVLRAYGWNLLQLPRTLRRRRFVQRRRSVSDADLAHLFAPGLPRARTYAEAVSDWLAGGHTRVLVDEPEPTLTADGDASAGVRAVLRSLRRHPAAYAGGALAAVYLIGLAPLLGAGALAGGQVAPWPDSPADFLRAYASPWNGEPVASDGFASPVQALLGLLSYLGAGSSWLAQRLLVLGLVPLAWLLALRAGRLVSASPAPRVLGASLYALSPPVLGALAQGRYDLLVLAALLPGLVLLAVRATDPLIRPDSAWRAAALLAITLAVALAAAPWSAPLLLVGLLVLLGATAALPGAARPPAFARVGMAVAAAAALLSPWLIALADVGGGVLVAGEQPAALPLWRALAAAPALLPELAGGAPLAAASAAAIVAAAVTLGLRTRPGAVAGLVVTVAAAALAAWAVARWRLPWPWAPALLLPVALAQAGLGLVAARCLVAGLRQHSFGLRQVGVVATAAVIAAGLAGATARLAGSPWEALVRDPRPAPAFVAADEARVGPYRVLHLSDDGRVVRWDVSGPAGPSMLTFGTQQSAGLLAHLEAAVVAAVGRADPRAAGRLALANVRYVVVDDDRDGSALVDALRAQAGLEPLPTGEARVYRVRAWLPRAGVVGPEQAEALLATGAPDELFPPEAEGLDRLGPGAYAGDARAGGLLVLSEAESPRWGGAQDGAALRRRALPPVNAFDVDPAAEVIVAVDGLSGHRLAVGGQLLLLLVLVSLALRPPRFTRGADDDSGRRGLPSGVATDEDGDAAVALARRPEVRS